MRLSFTLPAIFAIVLCWTAIATVRSGTTLPSTRPSATAPSFRGIELTSRDYLMRHDLRIVIASDGDYRSTLIENRSWGKGDIDPIHERIVIRTGQLSPRQCAHLAEMYEASDHRRREAVVDGPSVEMRWGGQSVAGVDEHLLTEIQAIDGTMRAIEFVPKNEKAAATRRATAPSGLKEQPRK